MTTTLLILSLLPQISIPLHTTLSARRAGKLTVPSSVSYHSRIVDTYARKWRATSSLPSPRPSSSSRASSSSKLSTSCAGCIWRSRACTYRPARQRQSLSPEPVLRYLEGHVHQRTVRSGACNPLRARRRDFRGWDGPRGTEGRDDGTCTWWSLYSNLLPSSFIVTSRPRTDDQ